MKGVFLFIYTHEVYYLIYVEFNEELANVLSHSLLIREMAILSNDYYIASLPKGIINADY